MPSLLVRLGGQVHEYRRLAPLLLVLVVMEIGEPWPIVADGRNIREQEGLLALVRGHARQPRHALLNAGEQHRVLGRQALRRS